MFPYRAILREILRHPPTCDNSARTNAPERNRKRLGKITEETALGMDGITAHSCLSPTVNDVSHLFETHLNLNEKGTALCPGSMSHGEFMDKKNFSEKVGKRKHLFKSGVEKLLNY